MLVISIFFLWGLVYTTWFATLGAIEGMLPAVMLTCIAGAILPWRKPDLYRTSPIAGMRALGIPLITITGTLGFLYTAVVFVAFLLDGQYLVNSPTSLIWIAGTFTVGLVIFTVSWLVRRSQGLDLSKAYQAIPPA
jgi:hypothetical protein